MAHDNGPLEKYDEVTFRRFGELIDGEDVFGCKAVRKGEGNEMGLGRMGESMVGFIRLLVLMMMVCRYVGYFRCAD